MYSVGPQALDWSWICALTWPSKYRLPRYPKSYPGRGNRWAIQLSSVEAENMRSPLAPEIGWSAQSKCRRTSLVALGLILCAVPGCIDSGEGPDQPQTIPEPAVQAFDYRVTDSAGSTTYASGCKVKGGHFLDVPFSDDFLYIKAKVPLGTDYVVELTNVRQHYVQPEQTDDGYCSLPYESAVVGYFNPTCYQVEQSPSGHELVSITLRDASGNDLTSRVDSIYGTTTDIERFTLRSQAYGTVYLNHKGEPCAGFSSDLLALVTIEQL